MADVSLSPEAEIEYESAHDWYLARSPSAAAGFERAVGQAVRQLAAFPGMGTPLDAEHRWQPIPRYPYALVYRTTTDGRVRVVGVPHHRQRPQDWGTRDRP